MNSVEVTFEAAHRLHRYNGKCRNIHGHSYNVTVFVEGTKLSPVKQTPPGMLIDYGPLKNVVKGIVDEYFDHAIILASGDPLGDHLFHFGERMKTLILPKEFYDATAECVAKYIFDLLLQEDIEKKYAIKISSVLVSETSSTSSMYSCVRES